MDGAKIGQTQNMGVNTSSIFKFLTLIGPYIVICFFLMLSFFNQNLKGVIYVVGLCATLIFSKIFDPFFRHLNLRMPDDTSTCKMFGFSMFNDAMPLSTIVYTFTLAYLIVPMIQNNLLNIPLIILLLLIGSTDIIVKLTGATKCAHPSGIFAAIVLGLISGIIWVTVVYGINNQLLYHTDYVSDKLACSMPSDQKFKCRVYKNGELVSTMGN